MPFSATDQPATGPRELAVQAVAQKVWGATWRLAWLASLATTALVIWWAFDTDPAMEVVSGEALGCVPGVPGPCLVATSWDQNVKPGDKFLTAYKVKVLRTDCTLFFDRQTRDAGGWHWPTSAYVTQQPAAVGPTDVNFTMVVPMDAAAGAADMENKFGWWCNPLQWALQRTREHPMPSLTVTVVRDPA